MAFARLITLCATMVIAIGCGIESAAALGCLPANKQTSPFLIKEFVRDPAWIMRLSNGDSDKIAATLGSLIATDVSVLPRMRALMASTPSSLHRSLGIGLGLAVKKCVSTDPAAARKILDYIRNLGNPIISAGAYTIIDEDSRPVTTRYGSMSQKPATPLATGDQTAQQRLDILDPYTDVPLPD